MGSFRRSRSCSDAPLVSRWTVTKRKGCFGHLKVFKPSPVPFKGSSHTLQTYCRVIVPPIDENFHHLRRINHTVQNYVLNLSIADLVVLDNRHPRIQRRGGFA